jgi:hypothetical protein
MAFKELKMVPLKDLKQLLQNDEPDAPIEVFFGNPIIDLGIATVPKILPRFWTLLASDGETLNDRQFALLMQVLLLRDAQDYELRVANIPMSSSLITLERDKKILRRMGLVFTERLYFPKPPGKVPSMRAQRWDMRSLFYNLELIGQLWAEHQRDLISQWEARGRKGNKPIYNFPGDFTHEVVLPGDVVTDILKGVFYPIPEKWQQRAQTYFLDLPTGLNKSGTVVRTEPETSATLPTGPNKSGTRTGPDKPGTRPTGLITRGHLLEDEEEEEEETTGIAGKIFAYFADRKGEADYHPTPKEQAALNKLFADGFTDDQIIAGIDEAFAHLSKPRHFTHCAAIARDIVRYQQETPLPEPRTQPETQAAAALQEPEMSGGETPLVIDADLTRAGEVYRSTGRQVTSDLLARFRLMVARCDLAARSAGSSGGDWLAEALTIGLGVAKPGNLLNYADAVLNDWIANGRSEHPVKTPRKPKSSSKGESGVHQGIRDYLEKRGGIPNGK